MRIASSAWRLAEVNSRCIFYRRSFLSLFLLLFTMLLLACIFIVVFGFCYFYQKIMSLSCCALRATFIPLFQVHSIIFDGLG